MSWKWAPLLLCVWLVGGYADAQVVTDLQERIDAAEIGATLLLEPGVYEGNVILTKPLTLKGKGDVTIRGDRTNNVVEIQSEGVQLENLTIEGSGMSRSSQEEYSGVRVMANGALLKDLLIQDSFHGIFLNRIQDTEIDRVTVIGQGAGKLGNQGNGIHIARSSHNIITNSYFEKTRDGVYVEYSHNNVVTNNTMTKTRYGLHYMYSNYNEFKDNHFVGNVGGAAIMHSDHILLEHNQFSFNQGSRSFGLLIQTSRDVHVLNNEFHLNQRGLYLEQSTSNTIESNEFFQNEIGIELWTSSTAHVFFKNKFQNNRIQALTVGAESNNEWFKNGVGNYWDTPMLDLDQDGIGDEPFQYTSALSALIEANELSYLFLSSPAIVIYEKMNELLTANKIMADDRYPLLAERKGSFAIIAGWIFVAALAVFIFRTRAVRKQ
ncbi:hypothetical protein BEP19_08460 [Ammoniphilus oxalaticus]|uniref:Periplasmic copper-binding protein NosD beta helix domain-containing protein n=1 Tax=Ammoniphilus oxalaticus TaxID=66863 RepID=A0A419SKA6_9BACL|nr:nitrous oxide reductase family maturation protein NosD [Ammoniphilus oxalaticus]RKD24412.1 hypothetical protein BEP19_08460 [Ammoniphilus oxalaticus]